jgi:hypothetical protein
MRTISITILLLIGISCFAQQYKSVNKESIRTNYEKAFLEIKAMLDGSITPSFKKAVFFTENAYMNDSIDFLKFDRAIQFLASRAIIIEKQTDLYYSERDKEQIQKNFAVFKLMSDTVRYYTDSLNYIETFPFTYDFDDFWGDFDWSQMFVTKLLRTGKGNCHSLPFLYKIIEEEIGGKAYLSMAPNHIYIKQQAKQGGWYNTELTSYQFPIDSWIMASGYIHLSAIQNGVYMDTLSTKQSLAVCLTDLAKGFERKFPIDFEFTFKCVELALQYYPNYPNAMILKAETMKKQFEQMMEKSRVQYASQMVDNPQARELYDKMEKLYFSIHQIGYRMIPKEMYVSWIVDLKRHRKKYENKEITNFKSNK